MLTCQSKENCGPGKEPTRLPAHSPVAVGKPSRRRRVRPREPGGDAPPVLRRTASYGHHAVVPSPSADGRRRYARVLHSSDSLGPATGLAPVGAARRDTGDGTRIHPLGRRQERGGRSCRVPTRKHATGHIPRTRGRRPSRRRRCAVRHGTRVSTLECCGLSTHSSQHAQWPPILWVATRNGTQPAR